VICEPAHSVLARGRLPRATSWVAVRCCVCQSEGRGQHVIQPGGRINRGRPRSCLRLPEPRPIAAVTELELSYSGISRRQRRRSRAVGRSGYGPERRLVTILFADVKGSMEMSRSVSLEEWWLVIADLFDDMCEGVSLFGGRVDGFTGDGVMAVFEDHGGPCDHAHRACAAALWVRDAMHRRADLLRRERHLELAVRIGVNSGEVLAGTIGRHESRRYTVNGYPVALAKRIEALTQPGRVWVSEDTAQLVARAQRLRDLGTVDVSGAPSKVRVFELLGHV
jgi:class 3 adenylate cyclase